MKLKPWAVFSHRAGKNAFSRNFLKYLIFSGSIKGQPVSELRLHFSLDPPDQAPNLDSRQHLRSPGQEGARETGEKWWGGRVGGHSQGVSGESHIL